MKYISLFILFFILFISCKKEEDKLIKNYYSCGVISTEVLSYTPTNAIVKIKFFVLDKTNQDELINQNIQNNIIAPSSNYVGILDSLKRITTAINGNFSAAVLISDGLDETINMEDYFIEMEPTVRKFLHIASSSNEVMLAKVGNNIKPLEIINHGFTRNADELDQPLANICKNGNHPANDTLPLLQAIDSIINYMNINSAYTNKDLIIFYSRRKLFLQNINLDSIINKALQSHITCHMLEITPNYTWTNSSLNNFLVKLNTCTHGIYYESPYSFYNNYEGGELPMDLLQVSGKLNEMMYGNFECFEMVWSLNSTSSSFTSGKIYKSSFSIKLSTNYEQGEINIPFNFYTNP